MKEKLLSYSNNEDRKGSLSDALVGADVFIGVSKGNVVAQRISEEWQKIRLSLPWQTQPLK